MSAVPNRDRASAAADAAEQRASAPVPREREDAAVAGQGAAVDRLTAMGFTLEHSRFGLAQGFPSVEEAVAFLFAGGADDLDAQRVLASSTPAGTALLRPGASRGTEACGVLAGGGASATGRRSGTAPLRLGAPSASTTRSAPPATQDPARAAPAVAVPSPVPPATAAAPSETATATPGTAPATATSPVLAPVLAPDPAPGNRAAPAVADSRGWRNNPAYKPRGGWRVKRAEVMAALKDAKTRKDPAAVSAAEALLRQDDHRKPADRSDARAADAEVTGSGRSGRQGQGGKGGRRSKARTPNKRRKREKQGVVRRGRQKKTGPARAVTFSPAPVIRRFRR